MATRKPDPTDLTVEEKLKNLYTLQTLLTKIDEIRTLRGELPLEVQDLEDEIDGITVRLEKIHEEIARLNSEVSKRKHTIEEDSSLIARYQEQINNVRNNREFDTLSKEIEFNNLDIELNEKKIREARERLKELDGDVARNVELLSIRRADLDLKRSELEEIVAETKVEEEKLRERAKSVEITIEPRLLTAFKRIRKAARNGLGTVHIERDACGGCFSKIPPQRQLDIRLHKKIIVCEYCGRILVDSELVGIQTVKTEEKPKRRSTRKKKEEED